MAGNGTSKPSARPTSKAKRPSRGGAKQSRRSLQSRIDAILLDPARSWGLIIAVALAVVTGLTAVWTREQPLVAEGMVAASTRLARVAFVVEDRPSTERAVETARLGTPRPFVLDAAVMAELESELNGLPTLVAAAEDVSQLAPAVRDRFGVDSAERLEAMRVIAGDPAAREQWAAHVEELGSILRRRPLLDRSNWERATREGMSPRIVLYANGIEESVDRVRGPIDLSDAARAGELETLIRIAGFAPRQGELGATGEVVLARLMTQSRGTFVLDEERLTNAIAVAEDGVTPTRSQVSLGQPIYRRGDVLSSGQIELLRAELRAFGDQAPAWQRWTKRLSMLGACAAIVLVLAGYVAMFGERIATRVARMAWMSLLLAGSLAFAAVATVIDPRFTAAATTAPTVFVAVLTVIAYDQRRAMAIGAIHALLVCVVVDRPIGQMAVLMVGVGTAVWQLSDVRDRRRVVRMSVVTGAALALATAAISLIDRPISPTSLRQMLVDAGWAAFAGPLVGGVTLFVLPTVERVFAITTGMTLIELRDPRHPLLRELQQRAPGTYSHSLNVASIAESAANAIGANSLLTYVGCLYHDIGKMNKPEYFVENQAGGVNKHDRLNPAMSLLVIVGHVKDGLAMAREYRLPKQIEHFIAEHHGTTLVEYFYRRAQEHASNPDQIDEDIERLPDEVDYRYPGPKPRSRETAIVMLSDAVESAARALSEPNASRIDSLTRELARKRLNDGQFDECDLTLRDLNLIVESVAKSVTSLYHGRVAYPGEERKREDDEHDAEEREQRA